MLGQVYLFTQFSARIQFSEYGEVIIFAHTFT